MSKQDQDWKESSGNFWTPEKKDDELFGVLIAIENSVGPNNSMMYTFEEGKSHEMVNVWGSTVLDSRMKGIRLGQEVKIVYKGLGEKAPGKHAPKLWQVFYRDVVAENIPL